MTTEKLYQKISIEKKIHFGCTFSYIKLIHKTTLKANVSQQILNFSHND